MPVITKSAAQRLVRFGSFAEQPAAAIGALLRNPPASIAGFDVERSSPLGDGAVGIAIEFGGGVVECRVVDEAISVDVVTSSEANTSLGRPFTKGEVVRILNAAIDRVVSAVTAERLADLSADAEIARRAETLFAPSGDPAVRQADLRLAIRCVDLTTLAGDDTLPRIRALCAKACKPDGTNADVGPVAAVCVYPNFVPAAVELTRDSGVRVASVAGAFPSSHSSSLVKKQDISDAVTGGADEIDIVLNRAAFLEGRFDDVAAEFGAAREATNDATLKTILEISELVTAPAIRHAASLAIDAGSDMIKTSTGKGSAGATPFGVLVMAEVIWEHYQATGQRVGLKIAGGVRTADDALAYVSLVRAVLGNAWLDPRYFRFGASGVLDDLVEALPGHED